MKLSALTVDIKAQEEGAWKDHPFFPGIRVCVRSSHSDFVEKASDAFIASLERKERSEAEMKALNREAERIRRAAMLAGWEGIEDAADQPIPFSAKRAYEFAGRDEVADGRRVDPRFFEGIVLLAESVGKEEQKAVKASEGNSPRRSRSSSRSRSSTRATASS